MYWDFIPLVVVVAVVWLLMIRPAQRRARAAAAMRAALRVGDRVVTTSGFHATVRGLDEQTLEVEIAPGVVATLARGAVGGLWLPDGETARTAYGETETPAPQDHTADVVLEHDDAKEG